ncbi:MAG: LUD domain-containing protein [Moheibacter sp.]
MSMWKKFKQLLVSQGEDKSDDESELEFVAFKSNDPIDVLFAKNFNAGGGQFFYCENEQEALENLKEIVDNEDLDEVICFESKLKSFLNRLNVKHTSQLSKNGFSFIECEYLVAYDGAIMLSSHQTSGRKLNDFPDNFIVYAHPKQLVSNISEALQRLKSSKGDNLPSNITSIRGKNMHNFDSSPNAKNIFLLLVEQI